MPETPSPTDLLLDPMLRDVPTVAGFKVLQPAVLYAHVGQGGMGSVYRGRHFKLDLDVAVKCLKRSLAEDSPEFVARFEREARLAASITHQNVVRVMDVHRGHGLHYIVMEFVRGESARERVQRKGKLLEQEALAILLGAVTGLAEAHAQGIVHRDIKPDNLLVSVEGRVKLADLGLAKAQSVGDQSLSLGSGVMGTPQYMAPEQWESPAVGPAADVWALGATLYFLLCGGHAFDEASVGAMARRVHEEFPSLRDACPGLRDEVYDMFARCVARDPDQRFADARAMLKVLRPLVEIGEDALRDAESGINAARVAVVTPPPRETLAKIREALETAADQDFEAETMVSPRRSVDVPETLLDGVPQDVPARRRWPLLVVLAVIGVAGLGWQQGWFGAPINNTNTVAIFAAKARYRSAMKLLEQPGKRDEVIAELQQALRAYDQLDEAKEPLALQLDKRAESTANTDLDAAFADSREASEWLPDDPRIKLRYESLLAKMQARLIAGLELDAPGDADLRSSKFIVSPTGRFELKGRVTSKGVRKLSLIVTQKKSTSSMPIGVMRELEIVAGSFSTMLSVPTGDTTIRFNLEAEQGIEAVIVATVRVLGKVGSVAEQPKLIGASPQYRMFNAAGCRMVPIPVEAFLMGSTTISSVGNLNENRHKVELTIPMWLADTEVTRAQWQRVMNSTPWLKPGSARDGAVGSGDLPASYVSQQDAIRFCNQLTELERAAKRLPANHIYVLPTEAQWEFACRGGSDSDYGKAISVHNLADYAVYKGGVGDIGPSIVGQRKANAFGLFDMQGNVNEWCRDLGMKDRFGFIRTVVYPSGGVDPVALTGTQRVYRGGSYASDAAALRCAVRSGGGLTLRSPEIGFRPALVRRR